MSGAIEQDYAKAGFLGRLSFGARPALLIVDMVEAYLIESSPLYAGPAAHAALASAARLRAAAHAADAPVVFTGVAFTPGGADGGLFYKKVPALRNFDRGNPLGAFPAALAPEGSDIVLFKNYASAFFGTSLASTLTALRIDTLLIAGYSTSGCVRASAVDALQHGFAPFVVRDACADRAPGPHEANLFDLQAKYAEVIGEAEALDALTRLQERAGP